MTTFQKIEKALLLKEPRAYVPAFRITRAGEEVRLFDGGRALALFRRTNLDIWAFSPFEPDVMANPEPPGNETRGQGNSVKTRQSGPSEGEDVRNLEVTVVWECKLQASRADIERFERVQRTFSNSRPDQQTVGSTAMVLA